MQGVQQSTDSVCPQVIATIPEMCPCSENKLIKVLQQLHTKLSMQYSFVF